MRILRAGLGIGLVAAVLAGCGSGDDARTGPSTQNTPDPQPPSTSQKPPRPQFDPPKVFEKTSAKFPDSAFYNQNKPRATLHEGNIYSVSGKTLNGYDGTTAEPLWSVDATIEINPQGSGLRPFAHEGKVYAAFSGSEPAKGTTPAHPKIEVVAVDAKSGKADWSTRIDVEWTVTSGIGDGEVAVVGASGTSVVVTYYSNDYSIGRTYVVDSDSHKVRWNKDQFIAADVDSGVVVGNGGKPMIGEPRSFTGLAETDGAQKWSTDIGRAGTEITPLSPKLVASSRTIYSNGDHQFDIVDVTTGKSLYSWPIEVDFTPGYRISCFYDQTSIIVCDAQSERTFAFDVNNVGATPLWEIKKGAGRVAPSLTAAYHGLIYGTGASAPVALDAKTGKDAPDAPGVAPTMVDKYLAVVDKEGTTYIPTK